MSIVIPDIPTAITEAETEELRLLAENNTVLEIGALLGYSTVVMAQVATQVVSVDPHSGYPDDNPRDTLEIYTDNLSRYMVEDKVVPILSYDNQILPFFDFGVFDFVFIDTTGRFDQTYTTIAQAWRVLRHGGWMAVHDCGHPEWPGAAAAVEALRESWGRDYEVVDRMAIFRK